MRMAQLREELQTSSLEMIERLSVAAEFRDEDTALHIKRMSNYSAIIAKHMGFSEDRVERRFFLQHLCMISANLACPIRFC